MKKRCFTVCLLALVTAAMAGGCIPRGDYLVYRDHLDENVLTVDDETMTLKDLAFYIAYEETTVEQQAQIYSPDDTNSYWNLHVDGEFVQVAAKQAVIDMAVHDRIFYNMAMEQGTELSAQEQESVTSKGDDFWSDLSEEQQNALGVTEDDLLDTLEKMSYAQKYQTLYAEQQDADYSDYDMDGDAYTGLLEEHTYKVKENVWEKIDFGNIILSHD